jgi:lysozyme
MAEKQTTAQPESTDRALSPSGADALKRREGGFYAEPYDDAGRLAIGYGMRMWKGKPVTKDLRITQEEADAELARQVREDKGAIVSQNLRVPVTQQQYDALVSVAWNLPARALGIIRKLNTGEAVTLGDFQRFATDSGGQRNRGLEGRGADEFAAFTTPNPSALRQHDITLPSTPPADQTAIPDLAIARPTAPMPQPTRPAPMQANGFTLGGATVTNAATPPAQAPTGSLGDRVTSAVTNGLQAWQAAKQQTDAQYTQTTPAALVAKTHEIPGRTKMWTTTFPDGHVERILGPADMSEADQIDRAIQERAVREGNVQATWFGGAAKQQAKEKEANVMLALGAAPLAVPIGAAIGAPAAVAAGVSTAIAGLSPIAMDWLDYAAKKYTPGQYDNEGTFHPNTTPRPSGEEMLVDLGKGAINAYGGPILSKAGTTADAAITGARNVVTHLVGGRTGAAAVEMAGPVLAEAQNVTAPAVGRTLQELGTAARQAAVRVPAGLSRDEVNLMREHVFQKGMRATTAARIIAGKSTRKYEALMKLYRERQVGFTPRTP